MDELRKYLNETLGLKIEYGEWLPDANLPLFLSRSASYARCVFEGIAFVAAKMENEDGLPDIKRVHNQLGRYTDLPVVIVSETLDARQRKALVVQGVPFVVPGGTAGGAAYPPGRKRPSSPSSRIPRSKALRS